MAINLQARHELRKALVEYMTGRIRTYAFDDQNSAFFRSTDKSLQEISRFLYLLHDDIIDHPISVAPIHWDALLRIVAFLGTKLEIRTTKKEPSWPFHDDKEWHTNESQLNDFDLPGYDIAVHYPIVNPWWNRIPSSIGFLILGCITVGLIAAFTVLGK